MLLPAPAAASSYQLEAMGGMRSIVADPDDLFANPALLSEQDRILAMALWSYDAETWRTQLGDQGGSLQSILHEVDLRVAVPLTLGSTRNTLAIAAGASSAQFETALETGREQAVRGTGHRVRSEPTGIWERTPRWALRSPSVGDSWSAAA